MSIENWNIRLKKHFDGLYQNVCNGKHRPIFILEHGLSSEEIHALQIDIREFISKRSPSSEDMLPWVVYATEIGYKFEGYEFWQTFENLTPGWQSKGDRNWIRSCFRKFNYIYEGANPAGLWAGKFTIICWPITHAILPIDLQRHLARILFDLRYQFSVEMFDDPNLLGGMIAERAWSANSRFQEFAQNSLLVGQIATALLVQGQDGYNSLILPSTLERIKRDLDNVRTARDWLKTASQHAQKVRLQGITRGRIGITPDPTLTVVGVKQLKELAIEPHLILQPVDINSWRVLLEMPDLSPLMNHFPQLKPSLLDSRCRVTGSSERWLARGWLLHGTQTITLQEWPESDEVLLTFENSTPLLDFILQGECLLKPGSILLFKIGSDTKGYQIDSLALRPGRKYIIVTISGLPHEKWLIPITLDCTGANAAILDMPDIIPPELEQFVTSIGLHLAKTILVEPAGLTASRWDGEGSAEWISSEQPRIAINVDHEVSNISIVLDGNYSEVLQVAPKMIGETVFVGFPNLSVGMHKVDISVRFPDDSKVESGFFELAIREPQPWRPGVGHKTGLTVLVEPRNPTLEQVWDNSLDVHLIGPESRSLSCQFSLFSIDNPKPLLTKTLPKMKLPVDTSSWSKYFEQNVIDDRQIGTVYDTAYSCTILFEADELGSFILNCKREFSSLRWLVRLDTDGYGLKLLDDSGLPSGASVLKYDFDKPDIGLPLENAAFLQNYESVSNGLFCAVQENIRCAIILPPWRGSDMRFDLHDLGLKTVLKSYTRSINNMVAILDCIEIWSGARLTGNTLVKIRRQQVFDTLVRYIFCLIGGRPWADIETLCAESKIMPQLSVFAKAMPTYINQKKLTDTITIVNQDFDDMVFSKRVDVVSESITRSLNLNRWNLIKGMSPSDVNKWLSEFALYLAYNPAELNQWAGEQLTTGIKLMLSNPELPCFVRSLVLISHY